MANEKRLIDANAILQKIQLECNSYLQTSELTFAGLTIARKIIEETPAVDAVILPHPPRPMLKDSNPYNTDVYCPECGTNLSGYYGGESLPLVTCLNCGEILDPFKAVTKMDGREDNEA